MSIVFQNISKSFGSKKVLQNISFEVCKGEILFVLGKSGTGKSVTLKQIVGLLTPDTGTITIDGESVQVNHPQQLAALRKKCGMVFQHPALIDSLSVFENVAFGLQLPSHIKACKLTKKTPAAHQEELKQLCLNKLALVHLSGDILDRYPTELSYGMQKRVSLARTLAPDPSYLLFDEPTTGLDPITTTAVNDLIFDLSRTLKVTSIVVSHDMACALKIADRILILDQGQILAHGTVDEIKASKIPLILDFLSESRQPL